MQSQFKVHSTCDIIKYLILRAVHYHQMYRPSSLSQVCPGGQVFVLQHWHMHCLFNTCSPWGRQLSLASWSKPMVYMVVSLLFSITVVSEDLLDSYCHCGARTEVAKRVLAIDSLCGAQTGVRERLLAFDSLWTGLVIVTSNVCSVLCLWKKIM